MAKAKISPLMIAPPVLFALLAAMFLWGMNQGDSRALPSTREGGSVPALSLTAFEGAESFDRAALSRGEVTLVNFWASWCAPCRAEHPQIETLAAEGVSVYGINYKDTPEKAARFLAEMGNPYAKLMADAEGRTALDWGLYGVPETFIVAGDGTIVKRFAGPITPDVLETVIRPAIAQAAAR